MALTLESLREKKAHGTSALPYKVYTETVILNRHSINLHWHDEMEIVYVEKGKLLYCINNQTVCASEGDYIFVKSGALHSFQGTKDIATTCRVFLFHLNFIYSFSPDCCQTNYLAPLALDEIHIAHALCPSDAGYPVVHSCFQTILEDERKPETGYELGIKAALLMIMAALYRHHHIVKAEQSVYLRQRCCENMKKALQYIHENYAERISIETLSRLSNLSRYHFLHTFKQVTSMTCVHYINRYRLEKAAKLLAGTDISVTDAAFETGYENISYFIKLFRQKYGVTPLQYQKNLPATCRRAGSLYP